MIPAPVLAAVAPVLVDKFADKILGGATASPAINTPTAAKPNHPHEVPMPTAAPSGLEPLVGMVGEYFAHEKSKASVRPAIMKLSGQFTILSGVLYVVAAMLPFLDPGDAALVTASEHACEMLIWAMGGGASFYGYKHTARSVEKMGGKA